MEEKKIEWLFWGLLLMQANHAKNMLAITLQPIFNEEIIIENDKLIWKMLVKKSEDLFLQP